MKKFLDDIEDLIKIQSSYGNWNYDPYMRGLANGLILAKSLVTKDSPVFLEEPAGYLVDKPDDGKAPVAVESA